MTAAPLNLTKGKTHYRITYERGDEAKVLDELIAMVNNPSIDFDWFDAAVLSHQPGRDLAKQLRRYLPKNVKP
jgi:hypothetical protein